MKRKTRKKLLLIFASVVAVASLLLLSTIAYISYKVEKGFEGALINNVDPFFQHQNLVSVSFDSGFLSSKAVSVWSTKNGHNFEVNHSILHYPWETQVYSRISDPVIKDKYGFIGDQYIYAETDYSNPDMPTYFEGNPFKFSFLNGDMEVTTDWSGEFRLSKGDLKKSIFIPKAKINMLGQKIEVSGLIGEGVFFASKGSRESFLLKASELRYRNQFMMSNPAFRVLGEFNEAIYSSSGWLGFTSIESLGGEFSSGDFGVDFDAEIPFELYRYLRDAPGELSRGIFLSAFLSGASRIEIPNFQYRFQTGKNKNLMSLNLSAYFSSGALLPSQVAGYYQGLLPYLSAEGRVDAPKEVFDLLPDFWGRYTSSKNSRESMISSNNNRYSFKIKGDKLELNGKVFKDYGLAIY